MNHEADGVAAASIDSAFAMGAGVSGALALLQHELTELGRSVAFGGTTLEQFTKLGATTHALSPDVAPIGGPMARSPPYTEEVGQQALDVLPQIEPVSTRDARVARIASSPVGRESGEQSRSPGAPRSDIADSIARPEFADGTATVPIVSIQRMASAPRDVSKADVPISASVPPLPQRAPLAARYFVTLAPPDLAVPPFPGSPSTSSAESGETIPNSAETISPVTVSPVTMPPATMPPVTVAPVTMSPVTNWPRPGYGYVSAPTFIGSFAPQAKTIPSISRAVAPISEHSTAPTNAVTSAGALPEYLAANPGVRRGAPPAAQEPANHQESTSELRQGTVYLDGARMGRWVVDRLAKYASRPSAGTTGIDPRITAAYPGAAVGA